MMKYPQGLVTHSPECLEQQQHFDEAQAAYDKKWPNACKRCNAEGGFYWDAGRDEPPGFDECPVCVGQCPRCRFDFSNAAGRQMDTWMYGDLDHPRVFYMWSPSDAALDWYNAFVQGTVACPQCHYSCSNGRKEQVPLDLSDLRTRPPSSLDLMPCECVYEDEQRFQQELDAAEHRQRSNTQ